MSNLDSVMNLAKQTLTISTSTNEADNWLWDRAQRLVRNVECICQLPELAKADLQIDRFCLTAAAYFSDTGMAYYLKRQKATGKSAAIGHNNNSQAHLELSVQIVEEKFAGCLDEMRIRKISRIISESGSHLTQMIEAMILSDARNLDDMGAVGTLNELRRSIGQGKGAGEVLQSWQRKIDYRYWQARLRESFRFEAVRNLAENRLATTEYFMNQLRVETEALDLKELTAESLEVS